MALNRLQNGLMYCMSVETRRQNVALFGLCWECTCQISQNFHFSVHGWNGYEGTKSMDVGVTNKY